MTNFARVLEIKSILDLEREMREIHADPGGAAIMSTKGIHYVVKVKNVSVVAANIIKQDMLARGGEVATAKGAITHAIPSTDILVMGTKSQFDLLLEKIKRQQFNLRGVAEDIKQALKNHEEGPASMKIGKGKFEFGRGTYIMGILNITPDSFSDGGKFYDKDTAVARADEMVREGVDIIDVGGESSRPGSGPIPADEEIDRVIPVIKAIKGLGKPISVDTKKAKVADNAIRAGAAMINDISGLRHDPEMAQVAADQKVPVVLMHIKGDPKNMQENPEYADLMSEIMEYLTQSIEIAKGAGISDDAIIIDPGIGFGKTTPHNLEILRRLRELTSLGKPILVGPSRKSMIGNVLNLPPEERVEGTAAAVAAAIFGGADIIRVHDVGQMCRVAKMVDAIFTKKVDK
ncbi:MAG: dihydropteroate synthase [bacterium]